MISNPPGERVSVSIEDEDVRPQHLVFALTFPFDVVLAVEFPGLHSDTGSSIYSRFHLLAIENDLGIDFAHQGIVDGEILQDAFNATCIVVLPRV